MQHKHLDLQAVDCSDRPGVVRHTQLVCRLEPCLFSASQQSNTCTGPFFPGLCANSAEQKGLWEDAVAPGEGVAPQARTRLYCSFALNSIVVRHQNRVHGAFPVPGCSSRPGA